MKLKTKLIPITTMSVAVASIAPTSLTSCSKDTVIGKTFDLTNNYYPKTVRHPSQAMDWKEALDVYTQQILAHPETFVEDYMWSKSWMGVAFEQYYFWEKLLFDEIPITQSSNSNDIKYKWIMGPAKTIYKYDKEMISNLSITTQKAHFEGVDILFPTLSFTLSFDSKVDQVILDQYFGADNISGYMNGTINGKIEFYNVPFYLYARTVKVQNSYISIDTLGFEPFTEWMEGKQPLIEPAKPNDWKINTQIQSSISGEITYDIGVSKRVANDWIFSIEANQDSPRWKYETLTLEETIGVAFTSSYYLEQIIYIGV